MLVAVTSFIGVATDAVFLVPVQLVARRTGAVVSAQGVHTAVFAASAVYAAFINIYNTKKHTSQTHTHTHSGCVPKQEISNMLTTHVFIGCICI